MNNYIEELLQTKLTKIKTNDNVYNVGKVVKISDYMIEVEGLEGVKYFEQVNIAHKGIGYVSTIYSNTVVIGILKQNEPILKDDLVYSTGELLTATFSNEMGGRIIDMFGEDKISGKKFSNMMKLDIESEQIPIMDRTKVCRPLRTGIVGIDLIYPIGKGQRQLIIGDKKTGKTQLCLDAIVNQKGQNVICLYIAIGKTKKEVKSIYYELFKRGAMNYTTILTATNDDKPTVLYLTPYVGLSMAEKFMKSGKDVLVVIDDLKRHADSHREISLMSGVTPGRDAYPADIFYTHSRLLERGCQYKNGASITILPIVETKGGDITDYISTNVISITDGQIVLSEKAFKKGQKPAIDYGLSVSRLGGAVQEEKIKKLGSKVKMKLLNYLDTRDVYELANMDEMNQDLRDRINEGKRILDNLNQPKFSPLSFEQIIEKFNFIEENNHGN